MNITKKNVSKAAESVLVYIAIKNLFPEMRKGRRFMLFLGINDGLAYVQDPQSYREQWAKTRKVWNQTKADLQERWKMADADYAMSRVEKVGMGPLPSFEEHLR